MTIIVPPGNDLMECMFHVCQDLVLCSAAPRTDLACRFSAKERQEQTTINNPHVLRYLDYMF